MLERLEIRSNHAFALSRPLALSGLARGGGLLSGFRQTARRESDASVENPALDILLAISTFGGYPLDEELSTVADLVGNWHANRLVTLNPSFYDEFADGAACRRL